MTPQEFYEQNQKFLWYQAKLLEKKFGGSMEEYIGFLYLRLEAYLPRFDPDRSSLPHYLCKYLFHDFKRYYRRYESEGWANWYIRTTSDRDIPHILYNSYQANRRYYHVPDSEWDTDVLGAFDSAKELWDFIAGGLFPRELEIIIRRFKFSHKLQEIGDDLGISKERVRQIEERGLKRIRDKLKAFAEFNKLFKDEQTELQPY